MKTFLALLALLASVVFSWAGSTINPANRYAWGANIGWIDWRGDTNNGAVIGEYVCSGYIWSANCGWINLGSGSPTNGIRYQNSSASDFGVNQDGAGNLRGFAWGANIGWINFETNGAPKVDLRTGNLSGYVWSANCGWISLSNAAAYVQTDSLSSGPLAPNGLPVAWLLSNFGTTNVNANSDPLNTGRTIAQDYAAGLDPNNVNSTFKVATGGLGVSGTTVTVIFNSVPTRLYYVQESPDFITWTDSGLGLITPSGGSTTTVNFTDTSSPAKFYRVQVVLPLTP